MTIENLRVERWFDAGITTPINYEADELHDVVIRQTTTYRTWTPREFD